MQKLIVSLFSTSKQFENKTLETIPLIIAKTPMKSGYILTKYLQDICTENYKTLPWKFKEESK